MIFLLTLFRFLANLITPYFKFHILVYFDIFYFSVSLMKQFHSEVSSVKIIHVFQYMQNCYYIHYTYYILFIYNIDFTIISFTEIFILIDSEMNTYIDQIYHITENKNISHIWLFSKQPFWGHVSAPHPEWHWIL